MKRVAVIGSRGQLGSALVAEFRGRGWHVDALTRETCNVLVPGLQIPVGVDAVINCAAIHRLDECEQNPRLAYDTNALGAAYVAKAATHQGVLNVYISSDYVLEPLSVYAKSKVLGEELTRAYSWKYLIIRFGSLFGGVPRLKGPSFVDQVLEKAQRGETIEAVADCKISPAYTLDVAKILANLLEEGASGMELHLSNTGSCSYYEFALEIVQQAGFQSMVVPVENSNPLRPRDVSVNHQLGFRTWQDALKDYLTRMADSRVVYNFGGKGEYNNSGESNLSDMRSLPAPRRK